MPAHHKGPYSAGYLTRFAEALSATPALTTAKGDEALDALMRGRSFDSRPVKPLGRNLPRPEPMPIPGAGSSLTGTGGGGTGRRHGDGYHVGHRSTR